MPSESKTTDDRWGRHDHFKLISNGLELRFPMLRVLGILLVGMAVGFTIGATW